MSTAAAAASTNKKFDLNELNDAISKSEARRQEAFDLANKIKVSLIKTRAAMIESNGAFNTEEQAKILVENDALIQRALSIHKDKPRLANLTFQLQDYCRFSSYRHFLLTGKLIAPSALPSTISDDEYLAGAVIGLNQDLEQYVIARATERDIESVVKARDIVRQCLEYLMEFDFRNGMLRRKYDGVKYVVKTCETVLYELSVTGLDIPKKDNDGEPSLKKMKTDADANGETTATTTDSATEDEILPSKELKELRLRYEHKDNLREKLIKRCRDAQKAAKQAIYALHRSNTSRALKLIEQCEKAVIRDLDPIITEVPALRHGSFANVLEEYAEAMLFSVWLNGTTEDGDIKKPSGIILKPADFKSVPLEPEEYVGGLCDLTGEVGRFAVQLGTERDSEGVKFCLETNKSILYVLETMERAPGGASLNKKMDPLRRSVEKLEKMLYELSLVQATGRKGIISSMNNDDDRKERSRHNDD